MRAKQALLHQFDDNGFIIIPDVYSDTEIENILSAIDGAPADKNTFRKTDDLFAIRQFLNEVPQARAAIFNDTLTELIKQLFGDGFFAVKAIYFDKPAQSNWFVAYHQDLTISVDQRIELNGYGPWTVKQNQFAVQPPIGILQNNFTIRIHLTDADENNGALKVIPGSNRKEIYRAETIDWEKETEVFCPVKKGGIMLMRPLLLHASNRSTNNQPRKVIHIEFSSAQLPAVLQWSEKYNYHETT